MSTSSMIPPEIQVSQEIQVPPQDQGFLCLSVQFKNNREALDVLIKDLYEHLNELLSQNHIPNTIESDKQKHNNIIAIAKAKEYFREYASGIITSVKNKLEESHIYDILPSVFRNELVEITKENLSLSYNVIIEKIVQTSTDKTNSDNNGSADEKDENTQNTKKSRRKGKSKIPKRAITVLKNWLTEHLHDPYPTHSEKNALAIEAGITRKQVQNWFINARGRTWRKTFNQEQFSNQIEEKLMDKPSPKLPPINPPQNNTLIENNSIIQLQPQVQQNNNPIIIVYTKM